MRSLWLVIFYLLIQSHLSYARGAIKPTEISNRYASRYGFAALAENLLPAVVNISTVREKSQSFNFSFLNDAPKDHIFQDLKERMQGGRDSSKNHKRKISSVGSGFLVSKDGFIVTNNHVIEGAKKITVALNYGKKYDAKIVGLDERTDLAVLKIDADEALPFVAFGDSDKARIGDWVLIIGNPYGLGGSVSAGIVSANNRSVNRLNNFIQTDASINKGNSGGPMFNMKGEVIGVSTALFSPSGGSVGIGFANPSSVARPIIAQLIENGEVIRGWIGVSVRNINQESEDEVGVFVIEVTEDSPADRAGLIQGDVILQFDGNAIEDMDSLPKIVARSEVGAKYSLVILRDGKEMDLRIKVGKLGEEEISDGGA